LTALRVHGRRTTAFHEALSTPSLSSHAYADFVTAYWKGFSADLPPSVAPQFCSDLQDWARCEISGGAGFEENYLASAPSFTPPAAVPEQGWSLPDTISTEQSWSIGAALTSARLRTLVDAWLATGRRSDGSEQPLQRDLRKTAAGLSAVAEFVAQAPTRMSLSIDPKGFGLILAAPDWSRPYAPDFFGAQEVTAKRLFFGIMASDWHQNLCKCRYRSCGRYFVSAKIRPVYRHGTFCSRDHRARASANAVTKARRLSGKEILIDAAARWLRERDCVSTWQSDPAVKRRLASFLSTKTLKNPNIRGGRAPVTAKWTTRNRIAIQKRTRSAHREVTVRLTGARNSQTKKGGGGQSEQGLFGA